MRSEGCGGGDGDGDWGVVRRVCRADTVASFLRYSAAAAVGVYYVILKAGFIVAESG